jgi:hypothetical protein
MKIFLLSPEWNRGTPEEDLIKKTLEKDNCEVVTITDIERLEDYLQGVAQSGQATERPMGMIPMLPDGRLAPDVAMGAQKLLDHHLRVFMAIIAGKDVLPVHVDATDLAKARPAVSVKPGAGLALKAA